jgi:glycosyltransferase involved in cell wall biosynthesis
MARGTPVIAFDRAAARELIVAGLTGFVVRDAAAMAEACLAAYQSACSPTGAPLLHLQA